MVPDTDPDSSTATDGSDPFDSTEEYYAKYRPDYDPRAFEYLADRFDLDRSARVLDLGCGAGQITVPIAAHAGEVVGIDPNEEMLRWNRRRADAAGRENVDLRVGTDADLTEDLGPFRLTTMGRAFHRVDQERTLTRLYEMTESGGGIALLVDEEWLTRGTREWQDVVYDTASEYVGDLPERTGPVEYEDPWDELIAEFDYADVETAVFESRREWDVDGVVGYVFSLSFLSPKTLGDQRDAFESALRRRLSDLDRDRFVEDVRLWVFAGRKPTEA